MSCILFNSAWFGMKDIFKFTRIFSTHGRGGSSRVVIWETLHYDKGKYERSVPKELTAWFRKLSSNKNGAKSKKTFPAMIDLHPTMPGGGITHLRLTFALKIDKANKLGFIIIANIFQFWEIFRLLVSILVKKNRKISQMLSVGVCTG
jgi:hypothetical protein